MERKSHLDSLSRNCLKHKVLTNLYREKAVHSEKISNYIDSRSLIATVVKLCSDTFKMLRKSHG